MKTFRRIIFIFSIVFIGIFFLSTTNVFAKENIDWHSYISLNDNFYADELIVTIKGEYYPQEKNLSTMDFVEISPSSIEELIDENNDRIAKLKFVDTTKEDLINKIKVLESREDISFVQPNYIYFNPSVTANIPNDTYVTSQAIINQLQMPYAWGIGTGSNNVIVGVIDSGIDATHPELSARINRTLCKSFIDNSPLTDENGHGTHVAGIIGATGNNSSGIAGVCWNVTLVSLKVLSSTGQGSSYDIANAIKYARDNNIPIINMSLGARGRDNIVISELEKYNGLVVCASGNDAANIDTTFYTPGSVDLPNIITVNANDVNDNVCEQFSNFGIINTDIFAPGFQILSSYPTNMCINGTHDTIYTYHLENGLHVASGTSQASPYVAGVAALILSKYSTLSACALKEIIINGIDIVLDAEGDSIYDGLCSSGGRLNAYQAINSYKTLTKNVETEVINNLNDGKGLFGFSYYGSGFVDITMNAVIQNATPSYPNGSFRLLNSKGEVVKKYEMTDYSDEAINKNGYNTLSVFLPESGYYYIDVDYDVENLSSLKLLVENNDVYSPSVNLFNYNDYQEFSIDFIDNVSSVDYFKQITLKQAASFEFDITLSGSARFVVLKRTSSSASSELTVIENEVIIGNNTIEVDLSHGTYYIGYFDLSQGGTFGLTMNRFVTESGSSLLITDPDQYTNCGSQITVAEMNTNASNKSYRQNTIIEGFTRIIYLGNGNTRQAYYWYSSNEDVATVSEFGTVFAQNVTQNTTVKIMAVYKTDPSIVYIKEFRILNDTESYASSPLNVDGITLNVHAGQFTYITFGDKDVPINWLQYYSWESSDTDYVTVDGFGRIYAYSSAIGETFTITGIYNYNTRVKITITVNIIE